MGDITSLSRRAAAWGLVVAAVLCMAPVGAYGAATFSPAGPPSPAVDQPRSVTFHPAGEYLAAAGASGPLSRYAILQGQALQPLPSSSVCSASSVAFKPSGSVLASADAGTSTVTLCSMSRTDGSITPLGSPLPTGTTPTSVQFSPDGKLLATTDENGGSVSMFTVGPTALAPVNDGNGFFVDFAITSATFSPDSRFLVVTSGCPVRLTLAVYAIAADGSLSKVDAVNPPSGICARDTAFVGPGNRLVALAADRYSPFQGELLTYDLSSSGQLVPVDGTVPAGTAPTDVAASPDGELLAYTSYQGNSVTLVKRSGDGAMTPVMTVDPGDGPSSVAFSADGSMLGVTTLDDDRVELYRVAPGPVLLPAGAPTALDGATTFLATASTGRVAVSTFDQDGVELFSLSADGRLTRTATVGSSDAPGPHGVGFTPDGSLLGVVSNAGFKTYVVSSDGGLTPAGSSATTPTPYRVAFSPDGLLAATANFFDDTVSLFSVGPGGSLTPLQTVATGDGPRSLAFSPDGSLLLTADESAGRVSVFGVFGTTLTAKTPIVTGGFPSGLAFRPGGGQLAVADHPGHRLMTYAIDGAGHGTPLDTKTVGTPAWVAYSPSGDLLATVGDPGDLWTFSVGDDGKMTSFGDPTTTDFDPYGLAFDASGRFLLIPQTSGQSVWVYPLAAPTLDTVIETGPAAFDNQASPAFDFDASYPSTFECRLDTGVFATCGRTPAIPVATDGPHTLTVRARDGLGNLDATPATYAWTADRTSPSVPALQQPLTDAPNLAPSVEFSWAPSADRVSGVSRYELVVDGTARATVQPSDCTTACRVDIAGLAGGAHGWQVRATDVAGNTSASAIRWFTVDAGSPGLLSLLAPIGGAAIGTARPTLSWLAATDGGGSGVAGYEVTLDDHALPVTTAASVQVPSALVDGTHTWSVVAVDHVGNRSVPVSATFRTDTTPPVARLTAGPRQTRPGISVTLDARASTDTNGSIAGFAWDLDGNGTLDRDTGGNGFTTTVFPVAGTYHLTVQVTDEAGLTDGASFDVTITPADPRQVVQGAGVRFIPAKATASRVIKLVLTPPAGARAARISNDDDPNEEGIKRVIFDGQAPVTTGWVLDPQTSPGKEAKQVFVWFECGTEMVHTSPTIVLDEYPPKVTSAIYTVPRAERGTRAPKARVKVRAGDQRGTGIAKIHIGPRCSGAFRAIRATAHTGMYTLSTAKPKGKAELRVTVQDAVGNRSRCATAKRR